MKKENTTFWKLNFVFPLLGPATTLKDIVNAD